MKVLMLSTVHGILLIKYGTEQVLKSLFTSDSLDNLAEKYLMMQKGELPIELKNILHSLKEEGYSSIYLEDPAYKPFFTSIDGLSGIICEDLTYLREMHEKIIQLWMNANVTFSAKEITERTKVLSEIMIKDQIAEVATQQDFQIKQAVDTMVDLDKSINFFSTRLREWYGLHFPELTDKLVSDNIQFARYVSKIGLRENFSKDNLIQTMSIESHRAEEISQKALRSMGGKLSEIDTKVIQDLADRIIDLKNYHDNLEVYISNTMDVVAPNLKAVIGASITAKLISIAGSIERLASMSSSTIQVLGAEKALFKAMRAGGDTPKYGIIFQWNKIRGEKAYLRGKIARMVSGKLSILAKVDYYKGDFIGEQYKAEIDRKIEILQKQFPKPPVQKDQRSKGQSGKKHEGYNKSYQGKGSKDRQDSRKGSQNYRDQKKHGRSFQKSDNKDFHNRKPYGSRSEGQRPGGQRPSGQRPGSHRPGSHRSSDQKQGGQRE